MTDIEQKKIFSKNLNYYLSKANKTQREVADAISVSPQTFNTWCQGIALPRMGKVQRLADYFHIEKSDLIDERTEQPSSPKSNIVKILGRVAAGIPLEAITDIVDEEEIPEELARTGEFFGLRISGDSMEPDIHNGDTVIVKRQDDAESDEIVIALVNGNDGVCKRLKKYADSIALISLNPNYEPMYFSREEIDEKPVRIIGKVVELRRKF
jgi:repressor LexA